MCGLVSGCNNSVSLHFPWSLGSLTGEWSCIGGFEPLLSREMECSCKCAATVDQRPKEQRRLGPNLRGKINAFGLFAKAIVKHLPGNPSKSQYRKSSRYSLRTITHWSKEQGVKADDIYRRVQIVKWCVSVKMRPQIDLRSGFSSSDFREA